MGRKVAFMAVLVGLAVVSVVLAVAIDTSLGRAGVDTIPVTGGTTHRPVAAQQGKIGPGVIKGRRLPTGGGVARGALLPQRTLVIVVCLVAGVTRRRRVQ